ncbi:APC family permease [Ligilactobacillus equi]|uniref:APC family permease n=1 Tax=Ligilactobacillus equi TaxID=137357 RepID=UPI002ED304DD
MAENKGNSLEDFGYKQELERSLSLKDLVVYGLVFMTPIAPFGIYGSVVEPSKGMISLAYLIGMIAMFFTALSYGQMSQAFPIAGSVYAYAQRGINKHVGFLAGWMILLDYIFVPSLLYLIAASSLKAMVPGVPVYVWVVLFIAFNTIINIRGIQFTNKANFIFLAAELLVLLIFLVCGTYGVMNGVGDGFTMKPFYIAKDFNIGFIFTAVSVCVLNFLGFDAISTLAEETKGGNKTIGRGIMLALLVVGIAFIVQTYIAALLHPDYKSFASMDTAFYEIAFSVGGKPLQLLTIIATILSWGIANSLVAQAAISRILFGMARDKNLPSVLAKVHPKYKTPVAANILVCIISLIMGAIFASQVNVLSSLVNFGALISFCVIHISVVNYYIRKKKSKNYLKHLVSPVIGFLIIGYVLINMDSLAKIIGGIWFIIGLVYYLILLRTRDSVDLGEL